MAGGLLVKDAIRSRGRGWDSIWRRDTRNQRHAGEQPRAVARSREVIRHNMGWTFIFLGYLILIGVLFYVAFPKVMTPS